MILRSHAEIMAHVKYLKKIREPFTMRVTNNRYEVHSRLGSFMNRDATFPSSEVFLIRQVYDYIVKNELYQTVPDTFKDIDFGGVADFQTNRKNIRYFDYNGKIRPGKEFSFEDAGGLWEVDLKTAYWEMIYKMGLISDELYETGTQKVSKKTRLAAVGALARQLDTYEFDGYKSNKIGTERRQLTEHIWFEICERTARLLKKAVQAAGKDYLFYWVDAIFIREGALKAVQNVFSEAGFNFSVHKVKSATFGHKNIELRGKLVDRKMSDYTIRYVKNARKELYAGITELPKNAEATILRHLQEKNIALPSQAVRAVLAGRDSYRTDLRPFPYRDPNLTPKEIHKLAA